MRMTEWPSDERPRERLLTHGETVLSDAELLAILLRTGTRGATALDQARQLLSRAGGLDKLFRNGLEGIALPGFGPAKRAQIEAALALARRFAAGGNRCGEKIDDWRLVDQLIRSRLKHRAVEIFLLLLLDNQLKLLAVEEHARGTYDEVTVHPREVVRRALAHGAAHLIVAHNHPSGHPDPSPADIELTRRLKEALALVRIRLIDHVVVTDSGSTSLAQRGMV
ncbi:MAG: DNA repair protein RadC [Xanthomonadales bacterium]|nr:DNA repair protein RadC [Xanthomonadales bacterium]